MEEAQIVSPAEAESAPAETVPADAEAAGRREAFESLIRGEYKAEFDERVQRIIDRRFRDLKRLEAQAERAKPLFQLLEKRYGGENAEPRERAAADLARRWQLDARMAKEIYPGFDLPKMLANDRFTALLRAGVDVKTAYEVVDGRALVANAMRCRGRRRMRTAARKSDARHALSRRTTQAHGNAKRRRAARAVAEDDADARRCERATRAFAENDAGAACGLKATI